MFYAFKTVKNANGCYANITIRIRGYKSLTCAIQAANKADGGFVTNQKREYLFIKGIDHAKQKTRKQKPSQTHSNTENQPWINYTPWKGNHESRFPIKDRSKETDYHQRTGMVPA